MSGGEGGGIPRSPNAPEPDPNAIPRWVTAVVILGAILLFGLAAYFAVPAIRALR